MYCVLCMLCLFVDTVDMNIKAHNALNVMFVNTVNTGVCGFHTTLYTDHWGVKTLLYSIYRASHPSKREGYCIVLPSCGFSCSPVSLRRQLCYLSGTCQTTRVIAGKTHSQSPIHKTKGVLSNPVILTYLWKQSCIPHTLTNTACLWFWPEKCSSMLEEQQPVKLCWHWQVQSLT